MEAVKDYEQKVSKHPSHIQFKCSVNNDAYEDILSYIQIMDHLNRDDDNPVAWKFKSIIAHQGPLDKSHKDYKGSMYNVQCEH